MRLAAVHRVVVLMIIVVVVVVCLVVVIGGQMTRRGGSRGRRTVQQRRRQQDHGNVPKVFRRDSHLNWREKRSVNELFTNRLRPAPVDSLTLV